MSTRREELIELLTGDDSGQQLEDIKLCLGFDRFISEEEICEQILLAENQVKSGFAKSVHVSEVDGFTQKQTIEQFLS